jgi:hypothetical protein
MPIFKKKDADNENKEKDENNTDIATATAKATTTATEASATSKTRASKKSDECIELKNMKYKSMLHTGNFNIIKEDAQTNPNLESILEKEKAHNKTEPWSKLDKTAKVYKIRNYISKYAEKEKLTDKECAALQTFLLTNLDQKKLMRTKDVIYDKAIGEITEIPCLNFNPTTRKFTLKRCEKRQSTLKSLAPTTTSKLAIKSGLPHTTSSSGDETEHTTA